MTKFSTIKEAAVMAWNMAEQFKTSVFIQTAGSLFSISTHLNKNKSYIEVRADGSSEATGAMCLLVGMLEAK